MSDLAPTDDLQARLVDAIRKAREDPETAPDLVAVAEELQRAGQGVIALKVAQSVIAAYPSDARVLRGASYVLAVAREFQQAAMIAERAVQLAPWNGEYRLHYGAVLLELRESRRAKDELEALLAMDPNSAMGWRNLSSAYANLGELEKALEHCDRAIALENHDEFFIHRAGLLNTIGRNSDALIDLKSVENRSPQNHQVARVISSVLASLGDSDAALKYARQALTLAPDNKEYQAHLEHLEACRSLIQTIHDGAVKPSEDQKFDAEKFTIWLQQRRKLRDVNPHVESLRAQGRIIFALLLREMRSRFGETQLGYAWAILEPVSHLAMLAAVFSITNFSKPPIGDSLLVYYFTGVLPYLLFVNTSSTVQHAVDANQSLLQIPIVTKLDVLLSRAILELITQVVVAVIMLSTFTFFGLNAMPEDIFECGMAFVLVWLCAAGIGIINSVCIHFFRSWDQIYANFTRFLYFASGIFISPLVMPDWVRDVLAYNPLLQGIDWVRTSFYSGYDPEWLDKMYLVSWSAIALALGFALERTLRRQLSVRL